MGMVLFTQSGTFKPSDYGLSAGDALQIVCVGGGGAGGGASSGINGSASSFGSIVTAAGGNGGLNGSSAAAQPFSSQGTAPTRVGYVDSNSAKYYPYYDNSPCGGDGGHGWWPYSLPPRIGSSVAATLFTSGAIALVYEQHGTMFDFTVAVGNVSVKSTAASVQAGGIGGCRGYNYGSYIVIGVGGAGGIGYGAGGGGAGWNNSGSTMIAGAGGNGGQIITHNLILNSSQVTTAHTITVGAGGKTVRDSNYGGDGANGCVAVFW